MSLNVVPIQTVAVTVPVLDINDRREYAIMKGGNYVQYKQYTSTSYSNNSFQFSCPPPSEKIIVNRKIKLNVPVTLTFTGTVDGTIITTLLNPGADAPRAYPISTNLNTLSVTINNSTVNINMSDVIQPLLRYNNPECLREYEYGTTPSEMDQTQSYADLYGSVRNPLGLYEDSSDGTTHRGAFPFTIVSNTGTSAVVTMDLAEYIYLSPFLFGHGDHAGFYGVRTMDFNFTWNADLSRLWSHIQAFPGGGTSTITNVAVTFAQPKLLFEYTTPPLTMERPSSISYPYYVVNRFPSGPTTINAGITSQVTSNNVQLNSIPRRMYIYLREQNSDLNVTSTDTYSSIENISVQFENFSGLLASASKYDLYDISRRNGCNLTWTQWSGGKVISSTVAGQSYGTIGSILCIEPGKDFGLPDNLAPGVIGNFMFQLTVTAKNVSSRNINYMLYITTIDEGTATIMNGGTVLQGSGVITGMDVLNAKKSASVSYADAAYAEGAGRFFSGLKHGLQRLKHHYGGVSVGGCSDEGSGLVGGAMMSRDSLRNRIRSMAN